MLDKQIQILSVDTSNFYSNREARLHWKNYKLRAERRYLTNKLNELKEKLNKNGVNDLDKILDNSFDFNVFEDNEKKNKIIEVANEYTKIKERNDNFISKKNKIIKESKNELLELLSNKIEANDVQNAKHHIRELRNINPCNNKCKDIFKYENEPLEKTKMISVFDSFLTRTIGAMPDNFTEDFMVVQVYYFDIIKDLIYNGFVYKGEKYKYLTSSAGQIRTKKTVFIKESVWNKYQKTLMCGLTIDDINNNGGNNPNKFLAYMALCNSATDEWKEFDIDKTIVIDDFETNVYATYDLVDETDYSVTRKNGEIPIPHTDGAGMMLPCMGVNRMVRLPWVKGLLGVFDFKKFIIDNKCSPIIKDIYGDEYDIIKEDIQIILTKSQFKFYKFYKNWEDYKYNYKKYNCTAGYTNPEEERIKDVNINYQMLQTLTDITDDEIEELCKKSNDRLQNICSSISSMKNAFGVNAYNNNMTYIQQAINLYPDLMNDEYMKITLRQIKDSRLKKFRSGSILISGKYTFLLPDFYAACEHWFMGIEKPKGLLKDGEVFCWLFRKNEKLDCLRSPHLYREHAVRKNLAYYKNENQEKIREWFQTNAIYTSSWDIISKILQFDELQIVEPYGNIRR